MALYKAIVKLNTEMVLWGSKEPTLRVVKSGAASKFKKATTKINIPVNETQAPPSSEEGQSDNSENQSGSSNESEGKGPSKIKKEPKPYGSHNGQKHVLILRTFEADSLEKLNEIAQTYINNITSILEADNSVDIPKMKHDHAKRMSEINYQFSQKYGNTLTPEQNTELIKTKARERFEYSFDQIQIEIISPEEIAGSKERADKMWHLIIRSKRRYRRGRRCLNQQELAMFTGVSITEVQTKRSDKLRSGCNIYLDSKTGRYKVDWAGFSLNEGLNKKPDKDEYL